MSKVKILTVLGKLPKLALKASYDSTDSELVMKVLASQTMLFFTNRTPVWFGMAARGDCGLQFWPMTHKEKSVGEYRKVLLF